MTLFGGDLPHPRFFGKNAPVAVTWRYRDIFNLDKLPPPPMVFGHVWNTTKIPYLGNNKCGNCTYCTQAHILQNMQRGVGRPVTEFSESSVVGDYSAYTGYDPKKPGTDKGSTMADAASAWRKSGIHDAAGNPHQITCYVQINLHNQDELWQAAWDFGGVGLGLQLPQSALDQWDAQQPWEVVNSGWWASLFGAGKSKIVGGHATALTGRNSKGSGVIETWNGITAATPKWIDEYQDEALAYFSLDYLDAKGLNPRGYDRTEIERKLNALA